MKPRRTQKPSVIRVENDSSLAQVVTHWIATVWLLGAAGTILWHTPPSWNFDFDSPEFNPVEVLALVLGAAGLFYLALSVRGTLGARRFGSSALEIQGPVVRMGATLKGVVRVPVELRPVSDYEIRLRYIETFAMGRGASESRSRRDASRVRWEATRVVPASVSSKEGIPFEFTLPEPFEKPELSAPGSVQARAVVAIKIPGLQDVLSYNQSPIATRWVLEIKAPLAGVGYSASFGVTVEDPAP